MVTNTLLTDYLELIKYKNGLQIFKSNNVYPSPDSFTYIKLITPYLKITEGELELYDNLKLNVSEMDNVLEN